MQNAVAKCLIRKSWPEGLLRTLFFDMSKLFGVGLRAPQLIFRRSVTLLTSGGLPFHLFMLSLVLSVRLSLHFF